MHGVRAQQRGRGGVEGVAALLGGVSVLVSLAGDAVEGRSGGAREVEVTDGFQCGRICEGCIERDRDGLVCEAYACAAVGGRDGDDGVLGCLG